MSERSRIDYAAEVADWPELSREQEDKIATILRSARNKTPGNGDGAMTTTATAPLNLNTDDTITRHPHSSKRGARRVHRT